MNKKLTPEEFVLAASLGRKIELLRNTFDLNQTEFGNKIGVSQKLVSKWERGKAACPIRYLVKICRVFKVSLLFFDPDEDQMFTIVKLYRKG